MGATTATSDLTNDLYLCKSHIYIYIYTCMNMAHDVVRSVNKYILLSYIPALIIILFILLLDLYYHFSARNIITTTIINYNNTIYNNKK